MTTIRKCIIDRNGITPTAEKLLRDYADAVEAKRAAGMSANSAERSAVAEFLDRIKREHKEKSYQEFLSLEAMMRLRKHMGEHPLVVEALERTAAGKRLRARHKNALGNALQARIGFDIHHGQNHLGNLETLQHVIASDTYEVLAETLEALRPKLGGINREVEGNAQFLRALYGEKTGTPADVFAEAWGTAIGKLNARFKLAGGILPDIGDRVGGEHWRLPNPSHDATLVRRAGKDAWLGRVLDLNIQVLDYEARTWATGARRVEILSEVFDTLESDGLNRITPGAKGRKKVANRHTDARVLFFRDAESWLAYNDAFGGGDVFSSIVGHVERLARETAAIEIFGPNPDHAMRVLLDVLEQNGVGATKRLHVDAQYQIASGADGVVSQAWAHTSQNIRNMIVANQLGSAALTAVGDLGFLKKTAEFNGLPAMGAIKNYVQLIGNKELRVNLAKLGIYAEDMLGSAITAKRFMDAVSNAGLTGRMADLVLRASLLTHMTNAGRSGFQKMILGEIADQLSTGFAKLPRDFRSMLTRYGITAEDWAAMGKATHLPIGDQPFFQPSAMLEVADLSPQAGQAISDKVKSMLIQEANFAVPTSNARVDALLTGFTGQKGTPLGETARFAAMYKRFPVLIIHTHLMRAITEWRAGRRVRAGDYLARLMIYSTTLGVFAYQAQQMSFGRDPAPFDGELLTRGALKGGALGIFGDVLFTDQSGYGRGLATTLAGPAFELLERTGSLTLGNAFQLASGKDTNIGRELVDYLNRYLLPGSSLWYARAAKDKLVVDNLQELVDPDYFRKKRARMERVARRERDQGFFWHPGQTLPERAPDLGAAFRLNPR